MRPWSVIAVAYVAMAVAVGGCGSSTPSAGSDQPSSAPGTAAPTIPRSTETVPDTVGREGPVQDSLVPCTAKPLFSVSPLRLEDIHSISPLGQPNPLPEDHMYFLITRSSSDPSAQVDTVDVFAPGDVTVYQLGRQVRTTNGVVDFTDYYFSFSPCREFSSTFGHISTLDGPLAGVDFPDCAEPYSIGDGSLYEHCTAEVRIEVTAGELIATAGGIASAALDFGSSDTRTPVPYVASPDHPYGLTAVCAIDYYSEPVRSELQALIGDGQVNGKHIADGCGTIFWDKKGTLQGNWYFGEPDLANHDIARQLGLLHDNYDTSLDLMAVGGTISDRSIGTFTPTHSGVIDREFSEVTPSDVIYCYPSIGKNGRVVIQLVSESEMKIEWQPRACSADIAFADPYTYQR